MNHLSLHITREKAIGFAAALLIHTVILGLLWRYQIIPPPTETLTVFVNCIRNTEPAQKTPEPPKPAPQPQPAAQPVAPPVPQLMTSSAPVTSPAQPIAPPPPVKPPPPATVSAPVIPAAPPVTFAPPVAPARPVTLGNELSVNCQERTPPVYPKQSIRLNEQGKTVLQVDLDESGRVVAATVKTSSGFSRLDEAAISAVKTWHCTPAKRNGVAVRSTALQPFNFTLKGR